MTTEIQWTWKFDKAGNVISKGRTWNFLSGCDKVSPACRYCYAESLHTMRYDAKKAGAANLPPQYDKPFSQVQVHESRLDLPTRWGQPCRIFVNSMSDTFHDDVPTWILAEAFATMAIARAHTFLVLTKRTARARQVLSDPLFRKAVAAAMRKRPKLKRIDSLRADSIESGESWPLGNVALGASTENQEWASKRIPDLLATPARWRFVSAEPLLGYVDFSPWLDPDGTWADGLPCADCGSLTECDCEAGPATIDWGIGGGESGTNARPTHPDHARGMRDQFTAAGKAFFWKQNGEWTGGENVDCGPKGPGCRTAIRTQSGEPNKWEDCSDDWATEADNGPIMYRLGKKKAGRLLDGVEWNQIPEGM